MDTQLEDIMALLEEYRMAVRFHAGSETHGGAEAELEASKDEENCRKALVTAIESALHSAASDTRKKIWSSFKTDVVEE